MSGVVFYLSFLLSRFFIVSLRNHKNLLAVIKTLASIQSLAEKLRPAGVRRQWAKLHRFGVDTTHSNDAIAAATHNCGDATAE